MALGRHLWRPMMRPPMRLQQWMRRGTRTVLAAVLLWIATLGISFACAVFPTYTAVVDSAGVVIEEPNHVNMKTLIVDVEGFKENRTRRELQLMAENGQYESAMTFVGQVDIARALYEWRGLSAALTRLHSDRFVQMTEGQSSFLQSFCASVEPGSDSGIKLYDERIGLAIAVFCLVLCTVLLGSVFLNKRRFQRFH